jgi:hypothetical protein
MRRVDSSHKQYIRSRVSHASVENLYRAYVL